MPPSFNKRQRIALIVYPIESRIPISFTLCSTFNLNRRPTKSNADTIRNKLNPINNMLKSVAPEAASNPLAFTGWKTKPTCSGLTRTKSWFRNIAPIALALVSSELAILIAVSSPNWFPHSSRPTRSETNAFGAALNLSQYVSSRN